MMMILRLCRKFSTCSRTKLRFLKLNLQIWKKIRMKRKHSKSMSLTNQSLLHKSSRNLPIYWAMKILLIHKRMSHKLVGFSISIHSQLSLKIKLKRKKLLNLHQDNYSSQRSTRVKEPSLIMTNTNIIWDINTLNQLQGQLTISKAIGNTMIESSSLTE